VGGAALASACAAAAPKVAPKVAASYATREDVRAFIAEVADEYGFQRAALARVFREVRFQRAIVAAMDRPLIEPPKWYVYARPLLAPPRVAGGVAYWDAHADDLARAEERYGVPAEIIVAILGIETFYGRNIGSYRVLDALSTLAFDYPRRAAFFRGELKQFLLLSRELGVSPLVAKGSFAGAMGVPQFMPGSYRSYAVDADGNGRPDLWHSAADIAGSVAHFLARHDWQPGRPVLLPAAIADAGRDTVLRKLDGGLSERRAAEAWAADGVTVADVSFDCGEDPIGLLLLEESVDGADSASYWIACNNFYVLTRYNRSRLYAAAVLELAKAIKAARAPIPR
jgi:membrane-bound lytic murein transglycosylase B